MTASRYASFSEVLSLLRVTLTFLIFAGEGVRRNAGDGKDSLCQRKLSAMWTTIAGAGAGKAG